MEAFVGTDGGWMRSLAVVALTVVAIEDSRETLESVLVLLGKIRYLVLCHSTSLGRDRF